ncbi:MAG: hypothetical protein HOP08_02890 [Cyclobacteriaceae bacterium]|nr:hypothetical protein [Cyclobacteriaceae bacterium]
MKKLISVFFLIVIAIQADAQCAMCRATLENNLSNGNIGIAAGINTGIMYLFFAPYVAIAVIGYLWYRTSKKNEQKQLQDSTTLR